MDIKPRQPQQKTAPTLPAPSAPLDLTLPDTSPPPRKKPRRRLFMWLGLGALSIVVVAIIAVVSAIAWYNHALQPRSSDTATAQIQVQSGATIDQVAKELEQKGIIQSALAFTLYMRLNNKADIKTGNYFFAPDQSVSEIVSWLNDGRVSTRKVTILPGQTLVDLKQELIKSGYAAGDVDAALSKTYTGQLFADKPANTSLEGYIFPETYFVSNDSTADQLLQRTFDEFETRLEAQNIRQGLAARGFTLYQGITLASIIAKEVSNPTDQKQVAQVFETRLANNMALGSDVTYHYAASLLGAAPSPDIDSPYNTHKYTGLPPGPIANFNLSALQAVVNPSPGNYLYFVAGDDGTTHYATTFEQHQQNIQKYCAKLCASN